MCRCQDEDPPRTPFIVSCGPSEQELERRRQDKLAYERNKAYEAEQAAARARLEAQRQREQTAELSSGTVGAVQRLLAGLRAPTPRTLPSTPNATSPRSLPDYGDSDHAFDVIPSEVLRAHRR